MYKILEQYNLEQAYNFFLNTNNLFGCAYCLFMKRKLDDAKILLISIRGLNSYVNWLLCLISIIKDDIKQKPTYFQIRNFYECDMNLLLRYKNYDFANKIIAQTDYFARFNQEIYKYNARICIDNELFKQAVTYLQKSNDIYYNDPESHFMLGEAYLGLNKQESAKEEFLKSNDVINGYYPAQLKLNQLVS